MTNERKEAINNLSPEMFEITKAFIKAVQSKDYPIMKRMAFYRSIIGKGEKWNIPTLARYGYKKELSIMETVDYMWWETKALRELLEH